MWQRVYSRLLSTAWKKHSTTLLVAPRHRFLPVIAGNVRAFCQKRAPAKGGIVREIGSISRLYSTEANWTNEALDNLVKNNKIVVFMKGTPLEPMCGFSKAVVTILQMHGIVEFNAHNVLEDEELRNRVKEYSSWPTVPQVYINGEFVGGCDIMIQLHQSGELIGELEKVGFRSILADEVD